MMGKAEWAHAPAGGLSAWGAGGSFAGLSRKCAGSGEIKE
jgi:hypothetical protein